MRPNCLVMFVAFAISCSLATAQQIPIIVADEIQPKQTFAYDAAQSAVAGDGMTAPAISSASCQACGDSNSCGCFRPSWFAGAEMTFLYVDSLPGGRITFSVDDSDTGGTDFAVSDEGGFQDYTYAPRLFVGRRVSENWSIVARYWHLDAFDNSIPDSPEGHVSLTNFLTVVETGSVELSNLDLEAIRSGEVGCWKIDGTFGARHSSFYADQTLNTFGVFTSGNFLQTLQTHFSSFDGAGITGSLTARRPVPNTCCSLFVSGRGSNAWGNAGALGRTAGTVARSPNAPLVGAATVTRFDTDGELAIGELQFGLQWERRLKCIPVNAFFRTAFEYQYWRLNMPPVGGSGFGGTIADITVNSFTQAAEGRADLQGLSLAAGFTW